jgi:hypothetical protein
MSDEMIVPDHPHADQRNWQPGDTDDDILTWEKVLQIFKKPGALNKTLRTLDRMRRLTTFFPPEKLADLISPHVHLDDIVWLAQYLEKVGNSLAKQKTQWTCAECGKLVWCTEDVQYSIGGTQKDPKVGCTTTRTVRRVRPDAVYCSNACRQKAYRKRKTPRYGKKARGDSKAVTKSESVTEAPLDTAVQP